MILGIGLEGRGLKESTFSHLLNCTLTAMPREPSRCLDILISCLLLIYYSPNLSILIIGRSKYYAARIAFVNTNGTYNLNYDDGEKEFGIDRSLIRLQTGPGHQPVEKSVPR